MIAIILYISSEEQNVLYNNCQVKMCFCNEITLLYILTCYFIIIWRNNSFIRENNIFEILSLFLIFRKVMTYTSFLSLVWRFLKKKLSILISKRYRFYFCYIMFLGKVEYNHEWSFTVFASKIDSAITFEYRFFSFHLICMRYEYIFQQKKNPTFITIEENSFFYVKCV